MKPQKIGKYNGNQLWLYKGNVLAENENGSIHIEIGPVSATADSIQNAPLIFDGLVEELIRDGAKPKLRKVMA